MCVSPHAARHTALYASRSSGVVLEDAAGTTSASCGISRRAHERPSPGACALGATIETPSAVVVESHRPDALEMKAGYLGLNGSARLSGAPR